MKYGKTAHNQGCMPVSHFYEAKTKKLTEIRNAMPGTFFLYEDI
jgi:hypothetical protein